MWYLAWAMVFFISLLLLNLGLSRSWHSFSYMPTFWPAGIIYGAPTCSSWKLLSSCLMFLKINCNSFIWTFYCLQISCKNLTKLIILRMVFSLVSFSVRMAESTIPLDRILKIPLMLFASLSREMFWLPLRISSQRSSSKAYVSQSATCWMQETSLIVWIVISSLIVPIGIPRIGIYLYLSLTTFFSTICFSIFLYFGSLALSITSLLTIYVTPISSCVNVALH